MTANLTPLTDKGRAAVSLMADELTGDLAAKRRAMAAAEPLLDLAGASPDSALAQAMLIHAMARQVRAQLQSRRPMGRALFLTNLARSGLAQIDARAEGTDLHMMGISVSASTPHAALAAWADAVDWGNRT